MLRPCSGLLPFEPHRSASSRHLPPQGHLSTSMRDEAIGCLRRAAATGPKTSFGRLGAARALLTEDRDAEAERVLRRTLALHPTNAMAYDLLGNLLAEFGRFDEAHDCFARAIAIAPLMAGAYYDLVRCRPVTTADDGLLARMEAALATPGLEVAQRLRVHLALGKAATIAATTPWRCSTSTWPTPCAGVRGHSTRQRSTRRSTA
jgi:tetratricopeptide (TPR) repeat protein